MVRFLAGFSMLSGVIILASSVASTRFRRIREVVVLKTLGARRGHIVKVFSTEFLVLGLLAGSVGTVFANVLSRVLLHKLDVPYRFDWHSRVAIGGADCRACCRDGMDRELIAFWGRSLWRFSVTNRWQASR